MRQSQGALAAEDGEPAPAHRRDAIWQRFHTWIQAALGKTVKSRDNRHMLGMMRDHWWWPWWVSTLIDVGIVVLAVVLLRRTSRRYLRAAALLVAMAGVVAAVMAPIVMTDKPNHMKTQTPMMP
jgi:hypothetical protein